MEKTENSGKGEGKEKEGKSKGKRVQEFEGRREGMRTMIYGRVSPYLGFA